MEIEAQPETGGQARLKASPSGLGRGLPTGLQPKELLGDRAFGRQRLPVAGYILQKSFLLLALEGFRFGLHTSKLALRAAKTSEPAG